SINHYVPLVNFSEHYNSHNFERDNPIIKLYRPSSEVAGLHNGPLCGLDKLYFYMINQKQPISYGGNLITFPPNYGNIHIWISKFVVVRSLEENNNVSLSDWYVAATILEKRLKDLPQAERGDDELLGYISSLKDDFMELASAAKNI